MGVLPLTFKDGSTRQSLTSTETIDILGLEDLRMLINREGGKTDGLSIVHLTRSGEQTESDNV
jgi:hypothetical protein